jgi:hypothetical protein
MSIKCLEVFLAAWAVAASSVSAEAAQQDSASLPQFMSSMGIAELTQSLREPNSVSHDTRQAAEEISAKFAGVERAATGVDPVTPDVLEPRTESEAGAHVAVLVTQDSSTPHSKETKGDQARLKPTTAARPSSASSSTTQPIGSKVPRKHTKARTEKPGDASGPPMRFASNALPGADVGWRTGIIGILTNPIFWH